KSDQNGAIRMTLQEIDRHFDRLRDVTDNVALMNHRYDVDLESAFAEMEETVQEAMSWDLAGMTGEMRMAYMSHMSFHREIIAETIAEARTVLIDERRGYLKRLVTYHKNFRLWLNRLEKKF